MSDMDILQFVVMAAQFIVMAVLGFVVWRFPRSPESPYIGKWVRISHATRHEGGSQETKGIVKHDAVNWVEVEEKGFRKVVGKAQMFNMVVHEKEPKV